MFNEDLRTRLHQVAQVYRATNSDTATAALVLELDDEVREWEREQERIYTACADVVDHVLAAVRGDLSDFHLATNDRGAVTVQPSDHYAFDPVFDTRGECAQ